MSDQPSADISDLLREDRRFPPPEQFRLHALANDPHVYEEAARDPEAFWAKFAGELEWSRQWDSRARMESAAREMVRRRQDQRERELSRSPLRGARRNKAAIIWEGEPGDRAHAHLSATCIARCAQFANVLKSLGVTKGDRVAIYMPMIPELAIAMLACARIGAVHSVVFGGFSAESLRDRINDQQARCSSPPTAAIAAGRSCRSRQMADEALTDTPSIEHVVVVQREGGGLVEDRFRSRWKRRATTGITS